jgi:hypothetical protein
MGWHDETSAQYCARTIGGEWGIISEGKVINRRSPPTVAVYRCQFCGEESLAKQWQKDACPRCGRLYGAMLAQDDEE